MEKLFKILITVSKKEMLGKSLTNMRKVCMLKYIKCW